MELMQVILSEVSTIVVREGRGLVVNELFNILRINVLDLFALILNVLPRHAENNEMQNVNRPVVNVYTSVSFSNYVVNGIRTRWIGLLPVIKVIFREVSTLIVRDGRRLVVTEFFNILRLHVPDLYALILNVLPRHADNNEMQNVDRPVVNVYTSVLFSNYVVNGIRRTIILLPSVLATQFSNLFRNM